MIRFGILGAGNIARRFAASLAHEEGAELLAVSCRSPQKAAEWQERSGVAAERCYAGDDAHSALLADPDVDAIYLALPHQLHHEWALAALAAGKAVLCEKPAMLTSEEMAEVADAARERGLLFMEAMKPRFVSLHQLALDALEELGTITRVETTLCNDMLGMTQSSPTYHLHGGPGAGVLLDCGIYCASWLQELCPGSPSLQHINGVIRDGVDLYVDATIDFGGIETRLECAFDRAKPRTASIVGSKGSLLVEELHRPQRAILKLPNGAERIIEAPYLHDDFYGEIHHFCELLRNGSVESPIMSLSDSVQCALVLDTVRKGFRQIEDTSDPPIDICR